MAQNTSLNTKTIKKIIFLTIFLDLVGFGIYITLGPYLARTLSASPFELGFLMSIYSIMQFLMSPVWGRLSDKWGRRPILLMSLLGGSLSYLGLAFAPSFSWMLVCRGLAGFFAANISTAHAAISDITEEKDRASAMGMIGAAFGLGFIVGPLLGSLFGTLGKMISDEAPFGIYFPALIACLITFVNFLWAYKALPETRKEVSAVKPSWLKSIGLFTGQLKILLVSFFLLSFAMPLMEVMLFPLVEDLYGWGLREAGMGFAVVGLMMAFTQGYLVRKLIPKYGEKKLLLFGAGVMSVAFFLIGASRSISSLAFAMSLLALGYGLMRPNIMGLISLRTNTEDQGMVLGATQSLSALTRILGPLIGGWLYEDVSKAAPFYLSSTLCLMSLVVLIFTIIGLKLLQKNKGVS